MAVSGRDWTVTLTGARTARRVEGGIGFGSYKARRGFVFLLVSIELENLRSDRETKYSSGDVRLTDERGNVYAPHGNAGGTLIEPNTGVTWSHAVPGNVISEEIVFVIDEDAGRQAFEFRFLDLPPIGFSLSQF